MAGKADNVPGLYMVNSDPNESDLHRLSAIEVAGFKSAANVVRLDIADITVLAGANSSGKSALLQPLLLMKQTIEAQYDPGGLLIDGPIVRFTRLEQMLSAGVASTSADQFTVRIEHGDRSATLCFGRTRRQAGVHLIEMGFSHGARTFRWREGEELSLDDPSILAAPSRIAASLDFTWPSHETQKNIIERSRVGLVARRVALPSNRRTTVGTPAYQLGATARDMIYLPGLRGNPERLYQLSSSEPPYPGRFNDYVAGVLHQWDVKHDGRLAHLGRHMAALGLSQSVVTELVDDSSVEIRVRRLPVGARSKAKDTVSLADVGIGVSQTLPVLVALLTAERDQVVYIEQPELHLHPRAQVALADILVEAANRGVQIIIETHSSLLILALQAAVAAGDITPERMSLNWFTRDSKGQTHVARAELHADGTYGDWPIDFDDVEFGLQHRYMTLAEQLRAKTSS